MASGTIYKKIVAHLKNAIENGELKIGDAIYSENLLCEKFNVSRTSVRKAIRQMVDENLLVSRQGVGTFVKSNGHGILYNAVCMVNHYSRLLRYDISDTFYMDMLYGVEEEINRRNMNFQMFSNLLRNEADILEKMAHVKVDGVIVDGVYQNSGQFDFFRKLTPHIVLLDGNPEESDAPVVAVDSEPAFVQLLNAAAGRGGTTIYLHEDNSARTRCRLNAFRKAVRKTGAKQVVYANYAENITPDNFKNIDHYYLICHALEKALGATGDCRTLIADSNHAAVKALNFLKRKGLSVPEDIAVSGFGGMNFSTMVEPHLTTVFVDPRQMAAAAAQFLLDHINGDSSEMRKMVPGRLLRRASF